MQKLPVVSGADLLKLLKKLGYQVLRQKGSHVRLIKTTKSGDHKITVPIHKEMAKGTLNDILSKVGLWNNLSRDELIAMLKKL